MDADFFLTQLYPLQDDVLRVIRGLDIGLYLTGGTALSRGYLGHRFSDDLDLFANYNDQFTAWCNKLIEELSTYEVWQTEVQRSEATFARLFVIREGVTLKIECVNDVPSHIGDIREHPILGRLDSPENVLANKITALVDREEPKDVADVWGLCYKLGLSIKEAITGASSKAAGIYPPAIARRLFSVTQTDWEAVRWISPPAPDQFIAEVKQLAESLILVE